MIIVVLSTLKHHLCNIIASHRHALGTIISLPYIIPILLSFTILSPSHAQVSASVSAESDSRFRGRSESRGQPVITGSLSYDDLSGFYTGGTVTFTIGDEVQGPLSYTALIGYAKRIAPQISIDSGAVVIAYTDRYSGLANDTFVELYSGLSYQNITARVRYSPNYQEQNLSTLYTEIDALQRISENLSATAHAGLLSQLGGTGSLGGRRTRYDFQAGLVRDIGSWSVSGTFNLGGPSGGIYFDGPWSGRTALVIGISKNF